jgi:hypothetical protein
MRLDMVTVSAVPEPGSLAIVGGAVALAAAAFRSRRALCRREPIGRLVAAGEVGG